MSTPELVARRDGDAIDEIRELLRPSGAVLTRPDPQYALEVLRFVGVSTKSYLGAVAYHTGGILLDQGWLRVFGGGSQDFGASLKDWNVKQGGSRRLDGAIVVAYDLIGGFFALNGGALGDDTGSMYYYAPDELEWEPLEVRYSEWLELTTNLPIR